MTPEQFTYWMQGFFEVQNPISLDENQTQIIKDHLKLVFEKQTPNRHFNFPDRHNGNGMICSTSPDGPTSYC